MGLIRSLLLVASDNTWLREHGVHIPFVRRAVRRFMPGEQVEDALRATSTKWAPWYVIPADEKHVTHAAVAHILAERIRELGLEPPRISAQQKALLAQARERLKPWPTKGSRNQSRMPPRWPQNPNVLKPYVSVPWW